MKKTLAFLLAFVMLFSRGITANAAEKKELNIFMWSDYISDDLIANFEDEYGVRVNLSSMNDNADSITKLTAGAGDGYDLIMTCDAYMESLIKGGYLEQLDLSQIPNAKNINKAYWSEQNQGYCVPYLMNYIYVVYDTERCPIEITCYNDLIRPEMKGQIGSVDGARNARFAQAAQQALNDGGRALIAIGSYHIIADDGLVNALTQAGCTVTPVK